MVQHVTAGLDASMQRAAQKKNFMFLFVTFRTQVFNVSKFIKFIKNLFRKLHYKALFLSKLTSEQI